MSLCFFRSCLRRESIKNIEINVCVIINRELGRALANFRADSKLRSRMFRVEVFERWIFFCTSNNLHVPINCIHSRCFSCVSFFRWLMKRKFLSKLAFLLDHHTKFAQETYTLNDRSDNLFLIGECAIFLLTEHQSRIFTYAKIFRCVMSNIKKNVKAHRVNTMCRGIRTCVRV